MHPHVYSSTINNSQRIERPQMPINEWMDKEDVVYIYTMEFYSVIKKNELFPFATTWMELEGIILSTYITLMRCFMNVCAQPHSWVRSPSSWLQDWGQWWGMRKCLSRSLHVSLSVSPTTLYKTKRNYFLMTHYLELSTALQLPLCHQVSVIF